MMRAPQRPLTAFRISHRQWLYALVILLLSVGLVLYVLPGSTFSGKYTNDLFAHYDNIHRIDHGQLPHVDYDVAHGPLAHYLPYLGYRAVGKYGGAFEVTSFAVALVMLLVATPLLARRVPPVISAVYLIALFGITMIPWNPGQLSTSVSWAMYYNRWCWSALAVLFLYFIPGQSLTKSVLVNTCDAIVAGLLLCFLFFTKMSYFAVGITFVLAFGIAFKSFQRAASIGVLLFVVVALGTELATGIVIPYLVDVAQVIQKSGPLRQPKLIPDVTRNLDEIVLVVVGYGGALVAGAKLKWLDVVFIFYVGLSSVALLNQNEQHAHLFSLIVLFAHMATVYRSIATARTTHTTHTTHLPAYLPAALAVLFIWPSVKHQCAATVEHVQSIGRADYATLLPRMDDVFVSEGAINVFLTGLLSGNRATLFLHARSTKPAQRLSQAEYVFTLRRGLDLLTRAGIREGSILTLDFANPFPVLHQLPAPRGVPLFLHIGRHLHPATAPAAELLKDVELIMVPKFNTSVRTKHVMLEHYGAYIFRVYQLVSENECWTLLRRRSGEKKSTAEAAAAEAATVK